MTENIEQLIAFYRAQGAPGDQSALIALLKAVQADPGGGVTMEAVTKIAGALDIRESLLLALIRRIPSLRLQNTHTLELCAGPNCGKAKALAACAEKLQKEHGFTLKFVPCMRLCGKGPNLRFEGQLHHKADEALIENLLKDV